MCLTFTRIRKWPWTKIGVIFSILFSTATFVWGLKQYEEMNRPYIGIDDSKIKMTVDFEGTTESGTRINPYVIIPVTINNYGKLPAYFSASFVSEYGGEIKPFQFSTNYILPDQEIDLQWAESSIGPQNLPTTIDDFDLCKQYEKQKIVIRYGPIGDSKKYVTVASPKMLELAVNSETARKQYSSWCWYGQRKTEMYVYDWSVDEMK